MNAIRKVINMSKIKWKKQPPKRSGTYLTKDKDGLISIVDIHYSKKFQEWWVSDYPNYVYSSVLTEDNTICRWGPKVT